MIELCLGRSAMVKFVLRSVGTCRRWLGSSCLVYEGPGLVKGGKIWSGLLGVVKGSRIRCWKGQGASRLVREGLLDLKRTKDLSSLAKGGHFESGRVRRWATTWPELVKFSF